MGLRGRKSRLYFGSKDPVERHYLITEESGEHPCGGQSRGSWYTNQGITQKGRPHLWTQAQEGGGATGVNLWRHLPTSSVSSVK